MGSQDSASLSVGLALVLVIKLFEANKVAMKGGTGFGVRDNKANLELVHLRPARISGDDELDGLALRIDHHYAVPAGTDVAFLAIARHVETGSLEAALLSFSGARPRSPPRPAKTRHPEVFSGATRRSFRRTSAHSQ